MYTITLTLDEILALRNALVEEGIRHDTNAKAFACEFSEHPAMAAAFVESSRQGSAVARALLAKLRAAADLAND